MRYSRQRENILAALRSTRSHPTAEAIYEAVANQDPNISLATVYRNLNQLAECGEILRIPSPSGKDRFDGFANIHYHLRCACCGKLEDLPDELSEDFRKLLNKISERISRPVYEGGIVVDGLCEDCKENGKSI